MESSRIGGFSRYSKVIVEVTGYEEDPIKNGVKEVFSVYGRPYEVPSALFGQKKEEKRIIDGILKDYVAT